MEEARRKEIGIIVGAQVGETIILTRTALCLINVIGDDLVSAEGAFGTHLLREDLTSPCLMFGKNGTLDMGSAGLTQSAGFGLRVKQTQLV